MPKTSINSRVRLKWSSSVEEIGLSDLKNYSVVCYGTPDGFYIDLIARLGEVRIIETLRRRR